MNYIKHLNKAFEFLFDDERLTSLHITLYLSLFQQWNYNRFRNPFSINRVDIMRASRIKSNTTYIRCLKELEEFGLLEYMPSFNSIRGTNINLFPLAEEGNGKYIPPEFYKSVKPDVKPTVQPDVNVLYTNNDKQNKECEVKSIPTHEDVKKYFIENNWNETEADTFFFHYEANGWMLKHNNRVKDWKAAAQKWNVYSLKFNKMEKIPHQSEHKAGRLHSDPDKDYLEKL